MSPRLVKAILVFCVWSCPLLTSGQSGRAIDSLMAKADDPLRLPESAILILTEQLAKYDNPADQAMIHDRIAFAYRLTGVLDSAASHAWNVLRLAPDDQVLCARAYRTLGYVAYTKEVLVRAYDFFLRAYRISREMKEEKGMMEALTYLGRVEFRRGHPAEARDQYQHALELAEGLSDSTQVNQLKVELVPVYRSLGDYRRAQEFLEDLMKRFRNDKPRLSEVLKEYGHLEEARKAPRKALKNYQHALRLDREQGDPSSSWQLIAQTHFQLGSLDTARAYVDSAELALIQHPDVRALRDCFELKYRIAEQQHDTTGAYVFFLRYDQYDDSVTRQEMDQRVRHVRDELILSANEAALRTADLESQLMATEEAQQAQWNNFKLIMGGTAFLFVLIGFAWYRSRLRMQSAVDHANERAGKAEVDKEKLFTVISHDLPQAIATFTNITRSVGPQLTGASPEERNDLLQQLNATSLELRQSLGELQEWVLSQSGGLPFKPDVFSCRQLAGSVAEEMQAMAAAQGVTIDFLIPDVLTAYGDKSTIGVVLRTLLFHAIQSGAKGQTIIIFCGRKERLITLGVRSAAVFPGFNDDDRSPLETVHRGLAPSLCRALVQRNGGELFAESSPETGTTIFFTLPERPLT